MVYIPNNRRINNNVINKHQRARLDDIAAKRGLSYYDVLNICSRLLKRTLVSYNDIYATEFNDCVMVLDKEFNFRYENGVRKVIIQ